MIPIQPLDKNSFLLVRSPLTDAPAKPIHLIDCSDLVEAYEDALQIDIRRMVGEWRSLQLWECAESGLRFYHPKTIVGDEAFYQELESHPWYYQKTKWEFEEAIRFLPQRGNLLEIGCGQGSFLELCQSLHPEISQLGLEVNRSAAAIARAKGLDVREEVLEVHLAKQRNFYDVVCAFQVLEHIPDPLRFLQDCVEALKPGGLLILGVPNNLPKSSGSPLVGLDDPLNLPPHHQGLWDAGSLIFLGSLLPLRVKHIGWETSEKYGRWESYSRFIRSEFKKGFGQVAGRLIYALGRVPINRALQFLAPFLPGHSLLAVYQKTEKVSPPR